MAREPVVIDFTGLGEQGHVGLMGSSIHGSVIDDERVSHVATRLVKPVPSVPEYHHLANAQIISRMPPVSATNSDKSGSNSLFARPGSAGLCRSPWVKKHAMAMGQIQEQSSGLTSEVSPGHSQMSSSKRFEVFAQQLAQQARKAASMYADPQQKLRNNVPMRVSPMIDETHANLSGAEPSFSHPSSCTQSAGFGSLVLLPLYSRMKPGNAGVENDVIRQQQHQQQAVQEVTMAPAHAQTRPPTRGKQPQTAQLSIFYAGMVNVYDEVPLDKAQAIMMLAGKGSTLSSNCIDISEIDCGLSSGRRGATVISSAVSQPHSRAGSPAPQVTTITLVGTPPPAAGPVPIFSNRRTPIKTGVELPQARKASLARFLERRKDRVRKGPYTNMNELGTNEARMRLNRENSPSPSSSSRLSRRSLSPPEAGNQNNVSFNAINAGNRQAGAFTSGTAIEHNSPKLSSPSRHRSISQERPTEVVPGGSPDINPSSPSRGKIAVVAKETEHLS